MEINGKLFIIGMYTGNIAVADNEETRGTFQFIFSADCKIDEIPRSMVFEVILPGEEPNRSVANIVPPPPDETHTSWMVRHAVVAINQVLRPGKIVARVIADGQETEVAAPWIVAAPVDVIAALNAGPAAMAGPSASEPPS
ncbi:MAG TPA: hypothetical protein VN805_02550 [Caulobacteraceae bacterium]|nr:hypothetical protein [Caulobacteraceae bacterium]